MYENMAKNNPYLSKIMISGSTLFFLYSQKNQLALNCKIKYNEYKKNAFMVTHHSSPFINSCSANYAVP
jgi:hypothetical protein